MTEQEQPIRLALAAWNGQVKKAGALIAGLTDEQLATEIAPGRNTGIYLVGHLIAVHDAFFPVFGEEERLYPGLEQLFVYAPDKSGKEFPSATVLRGYWSELHVALAAYFDTLTPADWLSRHTQVSEADFAKEPHRNKLNVLLSRTNHLSYHLGQLALIR